MSSKSARLRVTNHNWFQKAMPEEMGWVFGQAADGAGLPVAVLLHRLGELDHDAECSLQVESAVVGFAKDRA